MTENDFLSILRLFRELPTVIGIGLGMSVVLKLEALPVSNTDKLDVSTVLALFSATEEFELEGNTKYSDFTSKCT